MIKNRILYTLFIIYLILSPTVLLAAQYAITATQKTIIYADMGLTFPIGYISAGKKIKVGNVPKVRNTVLAVAISGKIAYLKISDIVLLKDTKKGPVKRGRFSKEYNRIDFYEFSRKMLSVNYRYFNLGSAWATMAIQNNLDTSPSYGIEYQIRYERYKEESGINYRIGIDIQTISGVNQEFLAPQIAGELTYNIYNSYYQNLETLIGVGFSPYSTLTLNNSEVTGYTFDTELSVEYSLRLYQEWLIKLGLGYYYEKLSNFTESATSLSNNPRMWGYHIYVGISYEL